jgi:hypothetical protein
MQSISSELVPLGRLPSRAASASQLIEDTVTTSVAERFRGRNMGAARMRV